MQDKPRRARLVIFRDSLADGGADRVTVTLLKYLDLSRFDPTLVLLRRDGVLLEDVPPYIPIHQLNARRLRSAWFCLARYLRRKQPDILLSTCSGANVIASWAHMLSGLRGRLVLSERSYFSAARKRLPWWFPIATLKALLYRRADAVIAVSKGVAGDLITTLRLSPGAVRVVYNPIDEVIEGLANQEIRHPWLSDGRPVVLAVGRLVEAKDYPVLLQAIARLRKVRALRLMILGDGPLRDDLLRLRNRLGLEQDVVLPGYVRNPFAYMSKCDVFVLSSQYEGLPNVLLEAMTCGAAVVSTDCPSGPSEIIVPGENGLLVPVGDVRRMAEAIELLLANPELRRRMGRRARRTAGKFRPDTIVKTYEEVLLGARVVQRPQIPA